MNPRLLFFSNLFPTAAEPYRGLDNATLLHALAGDFDIQVLSPRPLLPWVRANFEPRTGDEPLRPRWTRAAYMPKVGSPVNHLLMSASVRHDFEQLLRDFRPEIILSSWIYPDTCAAINLVDGYAPLVAIAQGSDVHQYLGMPARRRAILRYLPHAAAVVTRSRDLGRLLAGVGFPEPKLHTIYNGVSLDNFQPRDQAAARREYFLPEKGRMLLFAGNFFTVKNPHTLVVAFAQLRRALPDSLLVMAGGGPLEKVCRELVAKFRLESGVIFAGRKTPRDIARLMNAADLLVVPSLNEGAPNVILEAFASGLPVVASQVGGIPEILDQPFLGRMVPVGEHAALVAGIAAQLEAPRETTAIRAHAERFSWSATASQYRELLVGALR